VTDAEFAVINIVRDKFHSDWNDETKLTAALIDT
jgi:hypothetical protein